MQNPEETPVIIVEHQLHDALFVCIILSCCGFYGHEKHIADWLSNKNIFPVCKVKNPEIGFVVVNWHFRTRISIFGLAKERRH